MTLIQIFAFAAVALAAGVLPRVRGWLLLIASLLAVLWLQPALPIRNLDFWLPIASIVLAAAVWAATARRSAGAAPAAANSPRGFAREDGWTALAVALTISAVALTRYLGTAPLITATKPPEFVWVLAALLGSALLVTAAVRLAARRGLLVAAIFILLALFLVLKTDAIAQAAAGVLRRLTGQSTALASPLDIRWLGFSYIAFRLLHALRDRMSGRLPDISLREFVTYALFFPTIAAGPIDKADRFAKDLRATAPLSATAAPGAGRILIGVFKKFVIADGLAILALNSALVSQASAPGWMWFFLYAYALRIYFDFSGYTDIALGLGRWAGIALPENFNRPYLQPNLTAFWNSWHMTLAQWFRSYFFNPLTRVLRSNARAIPMGAIIFIGQLTTMGLIGLWHGVSWNFLIWGCWHGVGLFLHNRWGEWSRTWMPRLDGWPALKKTYTVAGTLATFQFVVLGWVWFALPSVESSVRAFLKLFGFSV
jgi:D-alanyl-lipoteichoic acid acyltransferase DltB (MBOAT superfamily)